MTNRYRHLVLVVLLLLATGISAHSQDLDSYQFTDASIPAAALASAAVSPEPNTVDPPLNRMAFEFYINGNIAEAAGNFYTAAEYYRKALRYFSESVEIRYSLATMLYRMQQFDEAIAVLQPASYEDVNVYQLRAACFRAVGMEPQAREAYLDVIRLDSSNTEAYSRLAAYYRKLDDVDSVIWAYENIVRWRRGNYRLLHELGKLKFSQNDIDGAKASFYQSIEAEPSILNVNSYAALAELYQVEQKWDSSAMLYHQGLAVDSNNVMILRELVNHYVRADSLAQALPHAQRIVRNSPMDRNDTRRLAMLYFGLDSIDVADSILTSLVRMGDRNTMNHYYLGRIAITRDDYNKARDEFTVVTRMADTVAGSWLDLAFTYRQLDREENELETYQNGLNHMKDEQSAVTLLFALGAAYEHYGHIESARETFEEIIAKVPDHAQSLNYLGYMLADRGEELAYAKELIGRAISIAPDNAAYLDSYGWVYYRMGKYEQALEQLTKAVQLDSDPTIFDHLGDTYDALGERDKALEWWRRALELDPDNETLREKIDR